MTVDFPIAKMFLEQAGWSISHEEENFEATRGTETLMWQPGNGWFWCNKVSEVWVLTNPDIEEYRNWEDLPALLEFHPDLVES